VGTDSDISRHYTRGDLLERLHAALLGDGIHSKAHKNVRCEASEDDLALPAFLDRRSRSQQIEEPAII